jgi:hypothetical protein
MTEESSVARCNFDDGYDPEKAPACFKRMTKEGVFALGFFDSVYPTIVKDGQPVLLTDWSTVSK